MNNSKCIKLDTCKKIERILDKDMLDFQYVDGIRKTCTECPDFVASNAKQE